MENAGKHTAIYSAPSAIGCPPAKRGEVQHAGVSIPGAEKVKTSIGYGVHQNGARVAVIYSFERLLRP